MTFLISTYPPGVDSTIFPSNLLITTRATPLPFPRKNRETGPVSQAEPVNSQAPRSVHSSCSAS